MKPTYFPRLIGAALLFSSLFMYSCYTQHAAPTYASPGSGSTVTGMAYNEKADFEVNHEKDKSMDSRKMIYEGDIRMIVKNRDSVNKYLTELAIKNGGYLLDITEYATIIRIPSGNMENIMDTIATFGKVKDRAIHGQDVTDRYYDAKTELETLTKTRERYLELLAKAQTVTEILPIERELERLNVQIDVLKGRLQKMDHAIEYTRITVHMQNRVQPGPLGYIGIGLWKVVKVLFVVKS